MNNRTDKTLAEVRRIKEECSLRYLSQTPEERTRHLEDVKKRAEERLGRPIRKVSLTAVG